MAYNNNIITANERQDDGRIVLRVDFSGNAGEPLKSDQFIIDGSTTARSLSDWVINRLTALNGVRTVGLAAGLAVGQRISMVAAPGLPAPTAKEIWQGKVNRLARFVALGVLTPGPMATAVSALKDDVIVTYAAGFLD